MDSRYRQEVAKFDKKDGVLAILVLLGYMLFQTGFVVIRDMLSLPGIFAILLNIVVGTSLPAVIVFLIVLRRKQGLSSIGLHKNKIWPAIRLGLLISIIPVLFLAVIPGIFVGFNELLVSVLLLNLVTTFFFAAHEDIIFVGFIQTRLYSFFKTDKAAITIGALLFALMHIPPWLVMGQIDTSNLLMGLGIPFLAWFIIHLILVSVFKKYYSLVPVFILHTINNYSRIFTQTTTVFGIDFSFIMLAVYILAAAILFLHTHKQSKKR
jgi:membrane protease YdiL (CAAX protease family)